MPPASRQAAELQGTRQAAELQGESSEGYATTDGTEDEETDPVALSGQLVAASWACCGSRTIGPGWLPSRRASPDGRERAGYGVLSQRRGQAKADALRRGIRWNHTMAGIIGSQEQVAFLTGASALGLRPGGSRGGGRAVFRRSGCARQKSR